MALSQLAMEDVEALYLGPSLLMADPLGPLLDQDEEEALSPSSSLEGKASASLSLSSYTPSLSLYHTVSSVSPPPPPPASLMGGAKAGEAPPSLPWLAASELLHPRVGADVGEDDAFVDLDWMSEKIDLSEFDLDSLIDSCSSDESPSSPQALLASLDSPMDLDLEAVPVLHGGLDPGPSRPSIPTLPVAAEEAPVEEMVVKAEPPSPVPSPACSLELGSEVDDPDAEKTSAVQSSSSFLLSGHVVVLLADGDQLSLIPLSDQSSDGDSGIESVSGSPARLPSPPPAGGSSRTGPYSTVSPSTRTSRVKSVSGFPKVVEKKVKKMEQNKTAATRYRQKKRVEQELLGSELEELEKRNGALTEKAESIGREIRYLKDLMEEVRKRRRGKSSSLV